MKIREFLATHPVFRLEQYRAFLASRGSTNEHTLHASLRYHIRRGHVLRIRRGLFAAVRPGVAPERMPVDPYLLTMGLADDAVIAFHSALQFHGRAHSIHHCFHYLTRHRRRPFGFRGQQFVAVVGAAASWTKGLPAGVVEEFHAGGKVRAVTLERTLVDLMVHPQYGGGWEEIFRSLDSVEFFNVERVVEHAVATDNAAAIARVGYYLDQRRDELLLEEDHLEPLLRHVSDQLRYMDSARRQPGRLVAQWNLIVPMQILERQWEEPA